MFPTLPKLQQPAMSSTLQPTDFKQSNPRLFIYFFSMWRDLNNILSSSLPIFTKYVTTFPETTKQWPGIWQHQGDIQLIPSSSPQGRKTSPYGDGCLLEYGGQVRLLRNYKGVVLQVFPSQLHYCWETLSVSSKLSKGLDSWRITLCVAFHPEPYVLIDSRGHV